MAFDSTLATRLVALDPNQPDPAALGEAAALIQAGRLVAFPTETVYGLGANALDAAAVARIFAAKERPAYDPIIVHVADAAELDQLTATTPALLRLLIEHFWPGPLTLVLPRSEAVPDVVTAGGPTVAVRSPAHPLARALLLAAGTPIAAPSANRFSRTSPTTAQHVWDDLAGRIDMILDGGPTQVGVESTVLDLTTDPPTLLRPGGVTREALEAVIGPIRLSSRREDGDPLPGPGMLDRHYAPQAVLWLFTGNDETIHAAMRRVSQCLSADEQRIGLLLADEDRPFLDDLPAEKVFLGSLNDLPGVARRLFRSMRTLDDAGVDLILARDFPPQELGNAVRDRLRRAAGQIMAADSSA
jgi:L-threonylcarbamoyladenylate synthase